MNTFKKLTALVLVIAALLGCLVGCKKSPLKDYEIDESTEEKDYYYVAMAVKNHGIIIVELDRRSAPITVDNFVKLVREGFYDGLTFHRVIEGFMIQGGDPNADGTGGSDENIFGEFLYNGWYNTIPHERGVISMARSDDYDSASSQFFICNASTANVGNLDFRYAAFGHVVEGMDVVDSITSATAKYGDSNGMIEKKNKQAVITEMKVIIYNNNK
ncbi:MAG: peptidylprolyl isomerase [Clostridia bacterium]|nr:peptidylprolyl isomerase [Clostridia bacterium]